MKVRTIGCIEISSISIGIHVADAMIKSASVELIMARTTCPGRYIVMVSGDTGAVESAVQTGKDIGASMVVDSFVLASIHEDVLPALSGTAPSVPMNALGVIETASSASCILAADAAAKAGLVSLLDLRFAAGLGGKAFVLMTGDVGSVQASVQAGIAGVGIAGPVLSHVVIPSPSEELRKHLLA